MYQVKNPARSEFIPIRHLNYHVQIWGTPAPNKTPLVMVHGWMDVAASYQFVVDALSQDHYVIAPDWRGFGQTGTGGADNFWFADYLADLDFLLDHYAPHTPVNLVGHSMGGNVAMQYAGVRPERVRRLINLEGFGLPANRPDEAPARLTKWLDELKKLHQGELKLNVYDSADSVARRLTKTNPRLSLDKARWLAQHWACEDAHGQWHVLGDAAHKVVSAHIYRVEEVLAIYQRISMPTLAVEAASSSLAAWYKGHYTLAEYHQRLQALPQVEVAVIAEAGHMLHHDQPEVLAALIERFIA